MLTTNKIHPTHSPVNPDIINCPDQLLSELISRPMSKLVPRVVELAGMMTENHWSKLLLLAECAGASNARAAGVHAVIHHVGILTADR